VTRTTRSAQAPDTTPAARTSTLDRPTLMRLAATEYGRVAQLLSSLRPEEWAAPTECPGWDVRAMVSHMLGMAEMAASIREGSRQQRAAKKRGGVFIDALTAIQVEERAALPAEELRRRFEAVAPKAARARRRTPGFIRRRRMPVQQRVNGELETWTLGFLIDTVLTRDPWMHRIDIARATGRQPVLTADHDGLLVADVVVEWAGRHGRPCQLDLSGPAGGTWTFGTGGPDISLDAVDFCRTLAGREPASDVLATEVPF
jgi:uncharacterized protein (TIGR03083 family)